MESPLLIGKPTRFKYYTRCAGRLLWCAAGMAVALALALWSSNMFSPFLLASLGGSAIFLFGLTRASAAQPRAVICGHLGGALIGIACFQVFGDALWVYVFAVVSTLVFMLLTRTVHPPAGANPLIMVQAHAGFSALWEPVGLCVLILVAVTMIWSRLIPGTVRYPVKWMDESPPSLFLGGWDDGPHSG